MCIPYVVVVKNVWDGEHKVFYMLPDDMKS